MSTSKHPPAGQAEPPRDDLEDNPGIGASKGTTIAGEDPHILQGASGDEGDVENDADATGAPTPQEAHRTNP